MSHRGTTYKGLDATVGDMRWRNNSGSPVRVKAWADGKTLWFQIIGNNPGWEVTVAEQRISNQQKASSKTEIVVDKSRPAGFSVVLREAHDGFDRVVGREVRKNGQVIHRDQFRSSYKAVPRQLLQGA